MVVGKPRVASCGCCWCSFSSSSSWGRSSGFYSGATPKLTVESALKGIGRRTPIQIRIDDPQRVEKVRVEVLQNWTSSR